MIRSNSIAIFGGCSDFINEQIRLDATKVTSQNVRLNIKKTNTKKHNVKVKKIKR